MKNFLSLTNGPGLDTMPLLHALAVRHDMWKSDDDGHTVTLRWGDEGVFTWSPQLAVLPQVRLLTLNLMRAIEGCELGNVLIERLASGKRLREDGLNGGGWQRYVIVVQGLPGSLLHCGDETVQMLTGEAWWFDVRQPHVYENNSADDRTHLMIDVRLWP